MDLIAAHVKFCAKQYSKEFQKTRQNPVRSCSQEVRDNVAVVDDTSAFSDGVEDLEVVFDLFVDLHNGSDVSATVTVVRSRPDGDKVGVLEPELKSVHDKLMGAGN